MISVRVKFFGPLREIVRCDELTVEVPEESAGDQAFEKLASVYPALEKWKSSVKLAVNLEYTQFSHRLHAGDEVSFIPPVSGG
jgi:molybdopterin converting factor subunit 1